MKENPGGVMVRLVFMLLFVGFAIVCDAQYVRTSYFMDGAQYRLRLNPALAPTRGYIHLPAVGQTNASIHSNALGMRDLVDLLKNADDADYYTTNRFYSDLVDRNTAVANVGTDLLSIGKWHGRGFISFNVGLRVDGNIAVSRELFTFMRDMKGLNHNDYSDYFRDMSNEELNLNAYSEIGLGYTRLVGDRLRLGGRLKCLLGIGNVKLTVNRATVQTHLTGVDPETDWTSTGLADLMKARGTADIDVVAVLETSFKGLELPTTSDGYINDVSTETNKMGISGFGSAIDLGFAVDVTNELTLSASLVDLGFIKWSKSSTQVAYSNSDDLSFDSNRPGDIRRFIGVVGSGEVLNWDMVRLTPDEHASKSRTTSLASTLAVGAECRLVDNKLSLGALYTNRFTKPDNESEVTLSVGVHPGDMLDFAVSYSPVMSGGSSFGLAMKLGPLFIGTDYMYLGNKTKCCNALVGLSIPLGAMER